MRSHPLVRLTLALTALAVVASVCQRAYAAERITLRNGQEFDCLRQEHVGDHVRLYLIPSVHPTPSAQRAPEETDYIEVPAASVVRVDIVPDPPSTPTVGAPHPDSGMWVQEPPIQLKSAAPPLTPAAMRQMLDHAGAVHNIDADLLASIVHAESDGNAHAVSRAGAQGLMQLMPNTASVLGVHDSFAPDENISGGTTYLDQLLTRYHDDIRLAVAAYNAGPAAVDKYHGIPPYAETRAYVARVVREFNRRKQAAIANHPAANASTIATN